MKFMLMIILCGFSQIKKTDPKKATKIKLFLLIFKICLVKLIDPIITFAVNESMYLGKMKPD